MKNIFKGKIMDFFRKAGIAIILGAALLQLSIVGLIHLGRMPVIEAYTQEYNELISMDSRQMAYQSFNIAPYKTRDVFISDEQEASFDFTSVGLSWHELAPAGTRVEAEIRFNVNGKWSDWLDIEEEEDPLEEAKKFGIASSNPASSMQYKFIMYGDGNASPLISNTQWTFIRAGEKISSKPVPSPKFSSNPVLSNATMLALNANSGTTVITRSAWGANESYRYLPDGKELNLIDRDPDFYQKYKNELQYSRVVDEDQSGNPYVWPLQYPEEVNKFIIHHTATTKNLDDPKQAIRDIYYYHAVSRGWGDIGYNYVVDQTGKVYEGRFGGEGVIGAHSGPGNHGSIGIAVLGNYQDNPISEQAVVSISRFINGKGKVHDIDTDSYSDFRGQNRPNIFGHRDIMSTTCPGEFLYAKLPLIRALSARSFNLKDKYIKDYDYQDQSEIYYLEIKPLEEMTVKIKIENIGKVNWNDETFIVVTQDDVFKNVISFPNKNGAVLSMINEKEVKPGEIATFDVKIKGGTVGNSVSLNIAPLVNGVKKIDDYIVLPVSIQQPIFKYEIKESNLPAEFIQREETFEGWVKLKNTGNVPWENMVLGDTTASVAPGETQQFNFSFKAPSKAGEYTEILTPKLEGTTFSSSPEISFRTLVYKQDYDAEFVSRTLVSNWEQGNSYTMSINFRNSGRQEWNENNLKATFLKKDSGLIIDELTMSPSTVAIGKTANINFTVKVKKEAEISTARPLLVNLQMDSHRIGQPVQFKYNIKAKSFQSVEEAVPEIRIKLGFDGNPEITANGSFDLYSNQNFLSTLSAGDIAKVSYENGKYKVTTDNLAFVKAEEIRFVPSSNAILKINNFEHRPAWNQDLNDNQYRGILEVRMVDDKLVVINELAIEDYLKGLGEVSNSELPEKIKAVIIAARSYAKFYTDVDEKFPGKPYHLDDNPDVSQKYLGYGLEKRSPNVSNAVLDTKGKVIGFNGKIVKAPYFNQSDGTSTKSAESVWGWTHTPYLIGVDDSLCDGDTFLGHGVGLSGCGAHAMAQAGSTYQEILKHYYTNIEILDLY